MNNPAESRRDSSEQNKRSKQNPHLSDEQLLLSLDGELPAARAADVKAHLEACWSCRARREQIERAIREVVEYRDHLVKLHLPLSLGGRAIFVSRLQQLARSVGTPSLWSRLVRALRSLRGLTQGVVPRHAWVAGVLIACCSGSLLTHFWEVPKVSASQVLQNAEVSEVRATHSVAKPVVYQKLRIRVNGRAVERTIYRDPVRKRQRDHLDQTDTALPAGNVGLPAQAPSQPYLTQTVETELKQTFLSARLNWEDPLSPAAYSAWHNSLTEKQDQVTPTDNDFLTLRTTTTEGPVAEARLIVRKSDFHPVEEDVRLQDTRQVEVRELAWEVLPMEVINPTIFAPELAPPPAVAPLAPLVPPVTGVPTEAELAEAELEARVALHAERADLSEQIEFVRAGKGVGNSGVITGERAAATSSSRAGQGSVVVRGIISTPQRKSELMAALRGIPHVESQLQTVDEAAQRNQATDDRFQTAEPLTVREIPVQHQSEPLNLKSEQQDLKSKLPSLKPGQNAEETGRQGQPPDAVPTPIRVIVVVGAPALEQQLEKRFPKVQDRAAFVNEAVEVAQNAMSHAWALRRLRDRYTADAVAELSRGSRQTLELLIRDHASALRQHVDAVRTMVAPLLPRESVGTPPSRQDTSALEVSPSPNDGQRSQLQPPISEWRAAVTESFQSVEKMHDNVDVLLAGPGEAASETQALVHDLELVLAELETQLPALNEQMRGPFLSDPYGRSQSLAGR